MTRQVRFLLIQRAKGSYLIEVPRTGDISHHARWDEGTMVITDFITEEVLWERTGRDFTSLVALATAYEMDYGVVCLVADTLHPYCVDRSRPTGFWHDDAMVTARQQLRPEIHAKMMGDIGLLMRPK